MIGLQEVRHNAVKTRSEWQFEYLYLRVVIETLFTLVTMSPESSLSEEKSCYSFLPFFPSFPKGVRYYSLN